MNKILVSVVLCLNFLCWIGKNDCYAQSRKIDSLLTLLKADKPDTIKVKHLMILARELGNKNPDTAIVLNNQALEIITPVQSSEFVFSKSQNESVQIKTLRAKIYGNLGHYHKQKNDWAIAIDCLTKAVDLYKETGNKNGAAGCLSSMGVMYWNQGNYPKALENYFEALNINEELSDKSAEAKQLNNIGAIYWTQKDYPKSLEYLVKALKIDEELKDTAMIVSRINNIGAVYKALGQFEKAIEKHFRALELSEATNDKEGTITALNNIGVAYEEQKNYAAALSYYSKVMALARELDNKIYAGAVLGSMGSVYTKMGEFKLAEQYLKNAIAIDESVGALDFLMQTEEYLYQLYDTTGRYKEALVHYRKAVELKDTVFGQENKRLLLQKEMNYEFDKKQASIKAEYDKQIAIAEAEKKKQQLILWTVIIGFLLVAGFATFVWRSLKITNKQKNIILKQKEIVERQKEKIVDSITYAQRIQQSILMGENELKNNLPESFIYYQPKDIVSGDFYWFSHINNKIIVAVVDCTGHGVPGAFMSLIGNTLLNQIVNEKQVTVPSEILRLLNIGVCEALHQQNKESLSDDGMTIALCSIDYSTNTMQYAGAENPLYIVTENQLAIIKGNSFGIGGRDLMARLKDPLKKQFTNHTFEIKKGQWIYLFSDGYIDQFGASAEESPIAHRVKKFGSQQFRTLLQGIQHLDSRQQKEEITAVHMRWKGAEMQTDDILVIGIRM